MYGLAGLVIGGLVALGMTAQASTTSSHGYPRCPQSLAAGVKQVTLTHNVRTSVWLAAHPGHNLAEIIRDTLACSGGGWQQTAQYVWAEGLPGDPVMHKGMWLIIDRTPWQG